MTGLITLYWIDGYKKIYPILTILTGLTYKGRRPYKYSIDISDIKKVDTKYLQNYLQSIDKILEVIV